MTEDPDGIGSVDGAPGPLDGAVREELAALPSPRMPADVRSRLEAAIRAEAARVAGQGVIPAQRHALGTPARHGPKRSWLLAGAGVAAAAVVLGTVGPWPTSPAPDPSAQDSPAGDEEGVQQPALELAATDVMPVLRSTGTAYTASSFRTQIARTIEEGMPDAAPAATRAAPVAACIGALPGSGSQPVLIDEATYEGVPAIIVAFVRTGGWEVVVQRMSCSAQDPAVVVRATVARP